MLKNYLVNDDIKTNLISSNKVMPKIQGKFRKV